MLSFISHEKYLIIIDIILQYITSNQGEIIINKIINLVQVKKTIKQKSRKSIKIDLDSNNK